MISNIKISQKILKLEIKFKDYQRHINGKHGRHDFLNKAEA